MSTSDSDCSIDWLASDDEEEEGEDNHGADGLSPQHGDSRRQQPSLPQPSSSSPSSSPSSSSSRESPRTSPDSGLVCSSHCETMNGDPGLQRDRDNSGTPLAFFQDTWDTETQGCISTGPQRQSQTQGCISTGPQRRSETHGCFLAGPQNQSQTQGYILAGPQSQSDTQGCIFTGPLRQSQTQGYILAGQQSQPWALWTTSMHTWDSDLSRTHLQTRERPHSPGLPGCRKRSYSPGLPGQREKPVPEETRDQGDKLFAHKCMELQCYVRPLTAILRGLRTGRYSERLSRFQENVAMDRIQRIMGVLQNPAMGERYVSILVKMEEMLQSWFPQVRLGPVRPTDTTSQGDSRTPAKRHKQYNTTAPPGSQGSLPPAGLPEGDRALRHTPYSSTHLKWLHTFPTCSSKTLEQPPLERPAPCPPPPPPPHHHHLDVTQDNAVSSSTDPQTAPPHYHPQHHHHHHHHPHPHCRGPPRRGPPQGKISSPCLERLLRAKESLITPRPSTGGSRESSWS